MPDVAFEGYKYFTFPMDHHEFIESGTIGNPLRATPEKGEEAFRRLSEHVARGVLELMKIPVEVRNREFGSLKAGELETRPEALEAALSSSAKIEFFRVKNSWGSFRPDRQFVLPGYHDLYMAYLDGPIKHCTQNESDTGSTDDCYDDTPLNDFVLPAGY
jgi:hypothetical protein